MIFDISFQSGEFYNQTNKGFFDYAIPMITMFSSLIMLYIAVKLYRNLDIRKIFVNKQFEEVLAFAEWIEEFNLQILVYKDLKIVQNYNIDAEFRSDQLGPTSLDVQRFQPYNHNLMGPTSLEQRNSESFNNSRRTPIMNNLMGPTSIEEKESTKTAGYKNIIKNIL